MKDKDVWILSCTQAAPGCAAPTAAIQQAGSALDWKTTVVDGMGTPAGYAAGIKQAVAAHADGVIAVAVDCVDAKSALQQAKSAGIPVIADDAYDCNDPKADAGSALFAASIVPTEGSMDAWATEWGTLKADYAVAATDGHAKVVAIQQSGFIQSEWQSQGYDTAIAKCTTCKVLSTIQISATDLATPTTVAQEISTVLQQNPSVTVLDVADDTILLEAVQAIRTFEANGHKSLIVVGGEGETSAAIDLVRTGVVTAEVAYSSGWQGYAGADAMNRVFAKETTIPNQGLGFQIVTKTQNLPAEGQGYTPTIDYKADFTKVWSS